MQHSPGLKKRETIRGVTVVRAHPLFAISKGYVSVDWFTQSIRQVWKSDVVVINLPQAEGIVPVVFAKLFRKRLITIYHCEIRLPKGFANSVIERVLETVNYFILKVSDRIVTYTADFSQNSKLLKNFPEKVECIYPPIIKPEINKRVQKMIRDKIGEKPAFVIGIAARLAAEKGIEYVLEAIPYINYQLPNTHDKFKSKSEIQRTAIKILIAGPMAPVGEQDYKKKILALVEKYRENVEFLGTIQEEDMGSFYSQIDLLVLPSVNSTEAFGMVQVEAMRYGVPVIASDLPGVRVPVQVTGMGKIVPLKDSKRIADAIIEILSKRDDYLQPESRIKNLFSLDQTIRSYDTILQSGI